MSDPRHDDADPWEAHAEWWQREFTDGADLEYVEQILPLIAQHLPRGGRLLDIGCGEGQVARMAASLCGMEAVGVDGAGAQLAVARERAGGPVYCRGSATSLCIRGASVDAAVACLVVEHIEDLDAALGEAARVLRPGGTFLLVLNHPLLQTPGSGWIDDQVLDPPEQYWRVGPYLVEAESVEQVELGVWIRFLHRPLSRYLNALADHGLVLERMVEPSPPTGFLERAPEYVEAATIPRLMYLRLRNDGG
jgi:SAM-dependent methyltransferase